MYTNRLAYEKSPYLLQHAHNPVDWHPWGPEAFEESRREQKPIFLSIGYSTCHWCHVMERESFEDPRIAALLNQHFVPVKVDREERPDVDRVYMRFVQATTGGGGWPMSVWLTPDLKPFFGGTYFPPEDRYGRPGFARVLEQIAEAWRTRREEILESSESVLEELNQRPGEGEAVADSGLLDRGFFCLRRTFDARHGGFGGAPKFPQPSNIRFLLRQHARTGGREALDMALQTLRAMARGGIRDHLGGGFHRYSVDARWFVPHFEKMLYDQAQLAVAYLEAYQVTGDGFFSAVARSVLDYVLRDLGSPEGGFYSAEDADSAIDPAKPEVKAEGAFYVWSRGEIEALLGAAASERFCQVYGVEAAGNVTNDPHGEFAGKNILYEARPDSHPDGGALEASRQLLLAARSKRLRPQLDDKILTAWNGLMISALALGAQVLEEQAYLAAARRAAEFLLTRMWDAAGGTLFRRYRAGERAIPGFAADYAMLAQGLLDLYEADFDPEHLEAAVRLTERQIELFEDSSQGGFFEACSEDASLVLRLKDEDDGAEPSSNSVTALNLLRLGEMTGSEDFRQAAERTLGAFASGLHAAPAAMPLMLAALGFRLSTPKQIFISGDKDGEDTAALLRALRRRFAPNKVVLLGGEPKWPRLGGATAYVCEHQTCRRPVTTVGEFVELLQ
jgi:uncharacterized protein YyaL (SSP411 family)